MNRLKFSIDIQAEKSTIWKALWDEKSYCEWVSVFLEGSYVLTDDWKEGSTVHFLGSDKNGIYSSIERHIPNKIMKFKHVGNVVAGKEQPLDDKTKVWSGATEAYTISEGSGYITLKVEIDVLDEHLEFMSNTFPMALEKVKKNCN